MRSEEKKLKCPRCGEPVSEADSFCKKCGADLSVLKSPFERFLAEAEKLETPLEERYKRKYSLREALRGSLQTREDVKGHRTVL